MTQVSNEHIQSTYKLLETARILLFRMMVLNDSNGIAKAKRIIVQLKDIIKCYEKNVKTLRGAQKCMTHYYELLLRSS